MSGTKCDRCDSDAIYSVRVKLGPGSWQPVGKSCAEHVQETAESVGPELAHGVQCLPFGTRH